MTDLVTHSPTENAIEIIRDGNDLFVTSLEIADKVGNEHKSVIRLIRDHIEDFEDFGGVGFQNAPFETNGGTQQRQYALLNEHQATLLMTFFRNNDTVKVFKKNLVKAFFAMRDKLSEIKQIKEPTRKELAQLVLEAEEQLEKVALELKEQKETNERFIETGKNANLRETAKVLDIPPMKFNDLLQEKKYLYRSNGNLIPYSQHIHNGLFSVKAFSYTNNNGEEKTSYQTFVTPKGVAYLAKKLSK